jgi:hypothetical protein
MSSNAVVAIGRTGNDLLTPKETAELRRCSERKLEWERKNGRGPAYVRDGARVLYRRRDIDAYIGANLHGGLSRRGQPRKPAETEATA